MKQQKRSVFIDFLLMATMIALTGINVGIAYGDEAPLVSHLRTSLPQTEILDYLIYQQKTEEPRTVYNENGEEVMIYRRLGWVIIKSKDNKFRAEPYDDEL